MDYLNISEIFISQFIDKMSTDNRIDYLIMMFAYIKSKGFDNIDVDFKDDIATIICKKYEGKDSYEIIKQSVGMDIMLAYRISPSTVPSKQNEIG
jgi:hypothetical protein